MSPHDLPPRTSQILREIACRRERWTFCQELARELGINPGVVLPILRRLEVDGWLEVRWEDPDIEEAQERRGPLRRFVRISLGKMATIEKP